MKVLTVDDDAVSRAVMRRALEQLGHQVIEAHDGAEAWELWQAQKPRVIVSDWQMPVMDGLKLCRRLRAHKGPEYVFFILVTGRGDSMPNRRAASVAGVDDFLPKPVDLTTLWMRLRVAERFLNFTTQVHQLESMLPMCSYCKKIRDDQNYWQQIEAYLSEKTGTEISHSVCPECYKSIVLPELERLSASSPRPAGRPGPKARRVARVRRRR